MINKILARIISVPLAVILCISTSVYAQQSVSGDVNRFRGTLSSGIRPDDTKQIVASVSNQISVKIVKSSPQGPDELRILGDDLGKFGHVYKVEYDNRIYFAKFALPKHLANKSSPDVSGEEDLNQIVIHNDTEAKYLEQLNQYGVENIPQLARKLMLRSGYPVYLYEVLPEGETVQEIFKRRYIKRFSNPSHDAINITLQLSRIVKNIHDKDILHLDITPNNVKRSKDDGSIILYDFGFAAGGAETHDRNYRGTWLYLSGNRLSPEHFTEKRDDIFALGMTLAYMLVGDKLFHSMVVYKGRFIHEYKSLPEIDYASPPKIDTLYLTHKIQDKRWLGYDLDPKIYKILEKSIRGGSSTYKSVDEMIKDINLYFEHESIEEVFPESFYRSA